MECLCADLLQPQLQSVPEGGVNTSENAHSLGLAATDTSNLGQTDKAPGPGQGLPVQPALVVLDFQGGCDERQVLQQHAVGGQEAALLPPTTPDHHRNVVLTGPNMAVVVAPPLLAPVSAHSLMHHSSATAPGHVMSAMYGQTYNPMSLSGTQHPSSCTLPGNYVTASSLKQLLNLEGAQFAYLPGKRGIRVVIYPDANSVPLMRALGTPWQVCVFGCLWLGM